ncbi:vitamin K-dependent protein S-like [Conger conger]|uniref:vitamin K-dependent protein S-like n=1 Tax=Conger conger TaxID=82655 RepID=UPI002A5A1476|nr:vitamin K-dependent protein S-like [Conger conger]
MRLALTVCLAQLAVQLCVLGALGIPVDVLRISKDTSVCYPFEEYKDPRTLYTGNSSMGNVPILQYKLTDLTSYESEFELRTLDPEGIIFLGDIGAVTNWFLLAVQKRHLSVQTSHGKDKVIVNAGPLISDGKWKKIAIVKQEMEVSVSVDGEEVVSVRQSQESQEAELGDGFLRIAIGASLSNSIPLGINVPLDACMRNWNWMNQNSSVLLQDSLTLRCWDNIVPGSFFPGDGHVGFLPETFGNLTTKTGNDNWTLSMELAFRPVEDRGVLFAILDPHNNVSFSLSLNPLTKDLVLHLKDQVFGSSSTLPSLCLGESQYLQLQVGAGQVITELGGDKVTRQLEDRDYHYLRAVWNQPGTMVYLGGLPEGASSFHGCLQAKIRGVDVDLDLARVRAGDIHSHSCPSALDIRDRK